MFEIRDEFNTAIRNDFAIRCYHVWDKLHKPALLLKKNQDACQNFSHLPFRPIQEWKKEKEQGLLVWSIEADHEDFKVQDLSGKIDHEVIFLKLKYEVGADLKFRTNPFTYLIGASQSSCYKTLMQQFVRNCRYLRTSRGAKSPLVIR